MSRPVSRILSWTTIHLGRPLLDASCNLPADIGRAARQRRSAPSRRKGSSWSCSRWGLP